MPRDLTLIMPLKDQKPEFLFAALDSVHVQTSSQWKLLVVLHADSPAWIQEAITRQTQDSRIRCVLNEGNNLASSLNTALKHIDTEFAGIVMSDDLIDPILVERLLENFSRHPEADFFHSSRKIIDSEGRVRSGLLAAAPAVTADAFIHHGSPVKHFMCWKVARSLACGGFDAELSLHACDDYDFPWVMLEAGCVFRAIPECLYYHRMHRDFYRLTTNVPMEAQLECLEKMFRKHGVEEANWRGYLERALAGYLPRDRAANFENLPAPHSS